MRTRVALQKLFEQREQRVAKLQGEAEKNKHLFKPNVSTCYCSLVDAQCGGLSPLVRICSLVIDSFLAPCRTHTLEAPAPGSPRQPVALTPSKLMLPSAPHMAATRP